MLKLYSRRGSEDLSIGENYVCLLGLAFSVASDVPGWIAVSSLHQCGFCTLVHNDSDLDHGWRSRDSVCD